MGKVGLVVLAERMPSGVAGLAVNDGRQGGVDDVDDVGRERRMGVVGPSQSATSDRPLSSPPRIVPHIDFYRRRRRGIAVRPSCSLIAAQSTRFGAVASQHQNVRVVVPVPAPEEVAVARDVLGAAQIAGAAVIDIVGTIGACGMDGGGGDECNGSGCGSGSGSAERAGGPCNEPPLALGGRAVHYRRQGLRTDAAGGISFPCKTTSVRCR